MERLRQRVSFKVTRRDFYLPVVAVTIILIIIIVIVLLLTIKRSAKEKLPESDRIECPGLSEENCTLHNCIWDKVNDGPSCYMKKDKVGFKTLKMVEKGNVTNVYLQGLSTSTPFGSSIPEVTFTIEYITESIVRFKFTDSKNKRYEVPVQKDFPLLQKTSQVDISNLAYEVNFDNSSKDFAFAIERKGDGEKIWDSSIGGLMITDQFLQISSYLPTEYVYGLGEHVHDTLKHDMNYKAWPLFAQDMPPEQNYDHRNLYGVHPFITGFDKSGRSYGIFFLNSNAMEVVFLPSPGITYRTTGGILDFFIFFGDNPEDVIKLYTSLIGRPMMPPYWSLGFHLSRYGYEKLDTLRETHDRTFAAKIPLACQFLDIDHMKDKMDFTYDDVSFSGLPEYIKETRDKRGLKWIIILDPGIAAVDDPDYVPYVKARDRSVFVKRSHNWSSSMFPDKVKHVNGTYGRVWPPIFVAFPDFFLDKTKDWWTKCIVRHYSTLQFDGLWIDMNEPANFGTNEPKPSYCEDRDERFNTCWSLVCPKSKYEEPPFNPLKANKMNKLSHKTICMDSVQGDEHTEFFKHYDVHSLYGWSQTQPTLQAAQKTTETRSLVITRSTYPSSGRYAGHWLGDNRSKFGDLKRSIIGMLEFNFFGIPYIGADVCGFFGDTTDELCKRWMQLGAFYPFFRNHNALGQKEQDPAYLSEDALNASRKAIERRIALNPYLYTLFYRAHVDGSTVVRPVFHEFPNDTITRTIDTQFMWGKSMMISPIVAKDRKSVLVYLPDDEWWKFKEEKSEAAPQGGQYKMETNADEPVVHIRGGFILPYGIYEYGERPQDIDGTKYQLYVFPKDHEAAGELFIDDGISIDTVESESYTLYEFTYANCSLKISKTSYSNSPAIEPSLESLIVFKTKNVTNVEGGYKFTTDEELQATTFTIQSSMNSITEISWTDSSGNCDMLP